MAASKPYDIHDLMRFTPADFRYLGVRMVSTTDRPASEDRVVVYDKTSGEDVSIVLTDFEVEALGLWITTRWPQERCDRHRPYKRGSRNFFSSFAECRCALVFQNELLHAWLDARVTVPDRATDLNQLAARALLEELGAGR